jgi:peptidyl-prolyl cis-trans isomerase A (cyclophilin A)
LGQRSSKTERSIAEVFLISFMLASSMTNFLALKTLAARGFAALLLASVSIVAQSQEEKAPLVSVKTSMGEIVIELYPDKAPKTVENFLAYAKEGFYTGTIFHRVISNFMIQGGGMTRTLEPKRTKSPVQIESQNGLKNKAGMVSMARTSQPDSATSQFFINTVDNPDLDFPAPDGHGYTVFGKVVKGIEIVNKIRVVPTIRVGGMGDVPASPVLIDSVTLIAKK